MAEEAPPGLSEFELGLNLAISLQPQDSSCHNTYKLILRCNLSFQNLTRRAGCWGFNNPGIPGKSGSPPATPSWPADPRPHKCTVHGLLDDACVSEWAMPETPSQKVALTAPPPPGPPSGGLFWANWAYRVGKQHLKHSRRHFGHLGQELQQAWLSCV